MQESTKTGKDDRRATIMAIARAAFLHDGYAATSMSQIAAKVGGSKATLYNYFPSKQELFFAIVENESATVLGHLYDIKESQADIPTALQGFCRRFITTLLTDDMTAFNRMVVAESARFPEVGQAMYELGFKRGVEQMATLIQLGMDAGVLRQADACLAAEFLLATCAGHLLDMKSWNVGAAITEADIEAHIAHTANAFLAVYGNDALAAEARAAIR